MDDALLATKLHIPPPRQLLVLRPRLTAALSDAMSCSLTLVSAPAGYGKSTLVSSWLHEIDIPAAWLSLDERDNDPIRFSHYLISAIHNIVPSIQPDLLGVLQEKHPAPFEALLNIIINEIERQAAPSILVLDDFQTIQAQPILEMVTYLLNHMPPSMHLVIVSRTDPPLPLSRLRVRCQLAEIRADQLRFTPAEIAEFLNERVGLDLSAGDLALLEARTEGWIAGLQLASIAMRGVNDIQHFISAFAGSHFYVMDYLVDEVLSLQSETVRSFLLQTSILERMCGPLCDTIVGQDMPAIIDGQRMLETMDRLNLFLIPLDDERYWYRYHHLFADVLNRHLELQFADRVPMLHSRAARWLEQNGYFYDAIHHAMMAGDQKHAAQVVDGYGCQLLMRGEVVNLLGWIEAVEPYSKTLPWIAIQNAWALCLTGQLDRAAEPLLLAENLVAELEPSDDTRTMAGAVTAARAYRATMQGNAHLAAELARQALDCLPVSNDFSCSLRSVATSILGDASWMSGNLLAAQHAYSDALRISQAAGNVHMMIIACSNLADILLEEGQLHQADRVYKEALQAVTLPDGQISPLADKIYAGLSRVAYEWNQPGETSQYLRQCIDLAQRWGNTEFQAMGYLVRAELDLGQGDPKKAQEAMRLAEHFTDKRPISPWRSIWLKSALARLWIAQGYLGVADDLIRKSGIPTDRLPDSADIPYLQEPVYLILMRLYLAQGDCDATLALSERLLQLLDITSRLRRVIEVLILRSLAFQGKRIMDQALATLENALSLAQPERYTRIFLDEGESMAKLLLQAKAHRMGHRYASDLLSEVAGNTNTALPPTQFLIEPLTGRELEVLRLIEAGSSNQDIAERLVISIPTVKRHISNIYAKLGVESRTQAVSIGRELRLFE